MMNNPLFFEEDLPQSVKSKYEAVIVAGLRARELQRGVKTLVDKPESNKFTTLALQELLEDKIQFYRSKDEAAAGEDGAS
jgi:DNA-directed RNA polymerase omega subunit